MASLLPGESSHHASSGGGPSSCSQDRPEEVGRWYFSRKEIEENSPSRRDGIDLKKETYFRKSYCTFLQDLGMRLKVPQITIATAIVFCHRFFIRQSHAKNDRRTIATLCMFLAGKVEETPRPLKDVILVSYEIIHKKDPTAAQRIKQKEVYEQQKELILLGERVVLATLGFDLNVHHPYKPLVDAIKKFKVAQNALAQVAWNFVNDGLRTSLCLQFKPHHIAAGAIFLAAKFLKVKLPSDGEKVWWQEFDVTPRQLEEVSNQMLELYEQNRVLPSQGSEVEGSAGGGSGVPAKASSVNEEHESEREVLPRATLDQNKVNGNAERGTDRKLNVDNRQHDHVSNKENMKDIPNKSRSGSEQNVTEDQVRHDEAPSRKSSTMVSRHLGLREGPVGQSPKEVIKMIDKDKVKAALEKRRQSRGEMPRKRDTMDEDDLIERELEDGVELAAEDEKIKRERRQSWLKGEHSDDGKVEEEIEDGNLVGMRGQSSGGLEAGNAEEGEMLDDASPMLNNHKRKADSRADRQSDGKKRHGSKPNHNRDSIEDGHKMVKSGYGDREHRRYGQENHL
ncbi:hypothetical protein K2173_000429 [Erythroxylum novogranatense]|uniref:B-like cyclin n=1 Tax=Erythroxylum novogranatense TaxID=1862640 RepID=A0AAV8SX65_9ROSI|nr:hypothetical protein K2173_000429 [Erythroxylum novogranatense]